MPLRSASTLARLAFAALIGLPTPAWSASAAEATLTDLHITLVDLDIADGIVPAIEFDNGSALFGCGSALGLVPSSPEPCSQDPSNLIQTGSPQVLGSVSGYSSYGFATMDLQIQGEAGPTSPAIVSAHGRSGGDGDSYWGQVWALQGGFTLTPHTLVVFEGDASLQAAATGGADIFGPWMFSEWARAEAIFTASAATGHQSQSFSDRLSASVVAPGPFVTAERHSAGGRLGVAFANLDTSPLRGQVSVTVQVAGMSQVVAVPEPAGWAAWLCGLTLLGCRHCTRTKR